ncbi:MAB_1171c family putative transporter [Streptomyces sp. NPDC088731]|uniref:MAB_1171c family putative transporter n=1 Tax=Streptomyces sp. NPDC088731 TaxID=3365878 RepID=UPI0038033FA6
MTPLDLAGYLIAVLMTAVALWRMPAALWGDEDDKRRRALWGCYAGFAAALWTKTRAVRIGLNDSAVTDLAVLIKHYTATIAILAILSYIVAIYGQYPDAGTVPRHVRFARAIQQVAAKASIATLVLLTVLFFTVVDRSVPSDRFVADHAGQWGATLYMSVFYLYLGAASAVCAYQWALATAGAGMRHLRVGLGMMTFAMFIGVGYTVSRTLFLWASVIDTPSESFALRFDEVTEAAQVVLFAFFAVGASIPALSKGQRRAKLWRAQVKLHGLWRELMTAFPEQPFDPPASLVRELTRFDTPADLRIDRWAADIADAVEKLRHYVPDTLLPAAKAAAAGGTAAHHTVADGTTGDADRAGPLAEAYWIKAALTAKNNGAPASTAATVETQHATDQDGEVAWLVRVATAYRTVPQDRAAQVLAHATSATPITSATPATSAATTGPSTASATTGPAARTAAPEETA